MSRKLEFQNSFMSKVDSHFYAQHKTYCSACIRDELFFYYFNFIFSIVVCHVRGANVRTCNCLIVIQPKMGFYLC